MPRKLLGGFVVALFFALTSALAAAPARTVTIRVVDAAGQPVANARVLVAADEMDAVGTTDGSGTVRVATTSSSVHVEASSGNLRAAATSTGTTITVQLSGGGQ